MKKIIGILMALCFLTVFVSAASAGRVCDINGHCTDTLDPVKVKISEVPIKITGGSSLAYAEGKATAKNDLIGLCLGLCPSASFQAGTVKLDGAGTLAFGSASSSQNGDAYAAGNSQTGFNFEGIHHYN